MSANDFVLVQGIRDTRATFDAWNREPGPVLLGWGLLSLAISATLLIAVWAVSALVPPDPTPFSIFGLQTDARPVDMLAVLGRNSLVLALHATACVAGFIAGASMPVAAAQRSGLSRWIHEKAGQLAIAFVGAVTIFSLSTQAWVLGFQGSTISYQLDISSASLIATVLPHALIELVALFLPLAAWLIASRRGEWNQLLAATFITVVIAIPMLVVSAALEVYIWPDLLEMVSPAI